MTEMVKLQFAPLVVPWLAGDFLSTSLPSALLIARSQCQRLRENDGCPPFPDGFVSDFDPPPSSLS
jgi:hypothetical protein